MRKAAILAMCLMIALTSKSVNASAFSVDSIETENYQYVGNEGNASVMSSDVIKTIYREYKHRLQYRRWNVTRGRWVDPKWIYA